MSKVFEVYFNWLSWRRGGEYVPITRRNRAAKHALGENIGVAELPLQIQAFSPALDGDDAQEGPAR